MTAPARSDTGTILLLVAVAGIVFLLTMLPGVGYTGDTAKFQFVGKVLGVPHPTGYPVYLLANHLFTRVVPFGSQAWKANLLSAVFCLAALPLLFRSLRWLDVGRPAAFATVLSLALTPVIWTHSIVAEVYSLHLLFVAAAVHGLIRWRTTGDDRWLLIACGVYALSFGNHITSVLLLPAFVFIVAATRPRVFLSLRKVIAVAGLVLLLGLAPYAYFLWRTHDPATPFVEIPTPDLASLWSMMAGGTFRSRMFVRSPGELLAQKTPEYLAVILRELLVFLPLAAVGLLAVRDRVVAVFLSLIVVVNAVWALVYDVRDYGVYLIPAYLAAFLLGGVGLQRLVSLLPSGRTRLLSAGVVLLPAAFLAINLSGVSQRDSVRSARKIEEMLAAVDRDAVIISPQYHVTGFFWYYLIGEGIEARRNIYLLRHYTVEGVRAYIEDGAPLELREERKTVPPGLEVYCISPRHCAELAGVGYLIRTVVDDLNRVDRPGEE